MVAEYRAGDSLNVLARRYGCAVGNVRSILRTRSVEMRRRGGRERVFTPEEIADIMSRHRSGESQATIAADYGTNQTKISRTLREAGIMERHPAPPSPVL